MIYGPKLEYNLIMQLSSGLWSSKRYLQRNEDKYYNTREEKISVDLLHGSKSRCGKYQEELVNSLCEQLRVLSRIATTEPQPAYAAFVNGFKLKRTYHIRTLPKLKQRLTRLDAPDQFFIPAITDSHLCSKDERLLISLPVLKGGLAIPVFSSIAELEFSNSRRATDQLINKSISKITQHILTVLSLK